MITQLFLSMKSFLMQLPKERFSNLKLGNWKVSFCGNGRHLPQNCRNKLCVWSIFTIIFFYFRCSNFEKGCDIVFQLSEQDEHLAKCPHQSPAHVNNGHDSTTCPQCGDILDKTIATSHQNLVCPNVTVACSFLTVGCDRKILRKDYQVWEEEF